MSLRVERTTNGRYIIHGTPDEIDGYGSHLEANGYYRVTQARDASGKVYKASFGLGHHLKAHEKEQAAKAT